eukprot:5739418-Prymnesium_polylepis.1
MRKRWCDASRVCVSMCGAVLVFRLLWSRVVSAVCRRLASRATGSTAYSKDPIPPPQFPAKSLWSVSGGEFRTLPETLRLPSLAHFQKTRTYRRRRTHGRNARWRRHPL